ncbi:hypothetical protein Salat_2100400 [Sesamum alatum]|uniref:Uncharacterized protein n=1 Tax=Sesamum alatum TaxID=300844 RepID=A0AAE1Y1T2_9LAMI|nr:hypothetical protein Salat_2100400 [Sesamum alatum]
MGIGSSMIILAKGMPLFMLGLEEPGYYPWSHEAPLPLIRVLEGLGGANYLSDILSIGRAALAPFLLPPLAFYLSLPFLRSGTRNCCRRTRPLLSYRSPGWKSMRPSYSSPLLPST